MKCDGPMKCSGEITSDKVSAVTAMTSAVFVATQDIESPTVTATESITTPALTLGETQVLTPTDVGSELVVKVVYDNDNQATYKPTIQAKHCHLNSEQQVLSCQLKMILFQDQ